MSAHKVNFRRYATVATALTLAGTAYLCFVSTRTFSAGWHIAWTLATLPLASEIALTLLNPIVCLIAGRHTLPRANFGAGIPDRYRTVVAIPTLLFREECATQLAQRLERHFLANRDRNLMFCLLSDFNGLVQAKQSASTDAY